MEAEYNTKALSAKVSDETRDWYERRAVEEGISLSDLVRQALLSFQSSTDQKSSSTHVNKCVLCDVIATSPEFTLTFRRDGGERG